MSRRAARRLAVALVAVAAVVLVAVFGLAGTSGTRGRAAPGLPRERLSGVPATLTGLLSSSHGRPVLVVFWASWCGPCSKEAPALERFAQTSEGRARIVGVDWSDARSGARSFIAHHRWTFPNVRDGEGTVGNSYGLTVLPTTFVVGAQRRILAVLRGPQSEASLEQALTRAERSGASQA
ncbi:MAG TPA: TlpA disulfide reductase family protein [Solirubrobacteraceae bacterium]|nr:TlpA disulfide reductase family protein [Solirubrobacteraceae bacterium]